MIWSLACHYKKSRLSDYKDTNFCDYKLKLYKFLRLSFLVTLSYMYN